MLYVSNTRVGAENDDRNSNEPTLKVAKRKKEQGE